MSNASVLTTTGVAGHGPESSHSNHAHFDLRRELPRMFWKRTYKNRGITEFMSNDIVAVPDVLYNLCAVDGIEEFNVYESYRLHVEKGRAFTWEEIAPKVVDILQRYSEEVQA